MVIQLYADMEERAKNVADMDRKTRLNAVWDLAEEFKVKYFLSTFNDSFKLLIVVLAALAFPKMYSYTNLLLVCHDDLRFGLSWK